MDHRRLRRAVGAGAATLALVAIIAGPATAASPASETSTNEVDRPFLSCVGFDDTIVVLTEDGTLLETSLP